MSQSKKPHENQNNWGLLLVLFAAGLLVAALFIGNNSGNKSQSSTGPNYGGDKLRPSAQTLNKLNQELKDVDIQNHIMTEATEMENHRAPQVGPVDPTDVVGTPGANGSSTNPMLFDQENPGQQVLKDIDNHRTYDKRPMTPEERIGAKLERDAFGRDYDSKLRDAQVRDFLEKAHRQGVDVRLNDNLDVTGIGRFNVEEPIRFPQSMPQANPQSTQGPQSLPGGTK